MNPFERSASELLAGYASGTLSPVEVTHDVLARAERTSSLNAFVVLDGERALAEAHASAQRWREGRPRGLLDGVPVSLKDLLLARDWPTRRGSRTTAAEGPFDVDSPAAARLREHGAVLLGKTTTSEFGLKGLGDSPLTGVTRNPWNPAHTPGGSSAGAVASVAAGVSPLAVGTDGGGSIRVPCALTGLVGLKPTFGRVPTFPAMVVGAPAHVGPIGRTVDDVARLLTVLAGSDDRDPFRLPADGRDYRDGLAQGVAGLRVGVSATLGYADLDPAIRAAFERAARLYRELGAEVEEADPGFASPAPILRTLFVARAAITARGLSGEARALLDPVIAESARAGEALSTVDYLAAEAARVELAGTMAAYHRRYDLLLTPTSAAVAPLVDGSPGAPGTPREQASLAAPFSLTRQPAASVPMGLHPSGLPMGLQIVGRHFEDALVLRAAAAFEQARGSFPAAWRAHG